VKADGWTWSPVKGKERRNGARRDKRKWAREKRKKDQYLNKYMMETQIRLRTRNREKNATMYIVCFD
jgi:hypothetical protein